METPKFVNGFESWQETHFEMVAAIILESSKDEPNPVINNIEEKFGRGGLYDLAFQYTNEFEEKNIGREWDGDFFDAIDDFIQEKFGGY